jgi:addiction module HigA family antidote
MAGHNALRYDPGVVPLPDRRKTEGPPMSQASIVTEDLPNPTPGKMLLADFLEPMGFSQTALARAIGMPPRRINEIVLGKRAITADTDLRLARYFGLSEAFWLGVQADYDLMKRRRQIASELDGIAPHRDAADSAGFPEIPLRARAGHFERGSRSAKAVVPEPTRLLSARASWRVAADSMLDPCGSWERQLISSRERIVEIRFHTDRDTPKPLYP